VEVAERLIARDALYCAFLLLIFKMSERRTGNGAPFAHVSAGRLCGPDGYKKL
jgi:hypothetical protein